MSIELGRNGVRVLTLVLATTCWLPGAADGQESQLPADVIVNGGGSAVLTASPPEGGAARRYPIQFTVVAGFDGDAPHGYLTFTFGQAFARDWGAVPPNDLVIVSGKVSEITEDADGFVHLTGTLTETDFTSGQGVVFLIDDLFDVKFGGTLPPNEFVLQWCLLPEFPIQVTNGILTVNAPGSLGRAALPGGSTAASQFAADPGGTCSRRGHN